jgi:hypothetical protein
VGGIVLKASGRLPLTARAPLRAGIWRIQWIKNELVQPNGGKSCHSDGSRQLHLLQQRLRLEPEGQPRPSATDQAILQMPPDSKMQPKIVATISSSNRKMVFLRVEVPKKVFLHRLTVTTFLTEIGSNLVIEPKLGCLKR